MLALALNRPYTCQHPAPADRLSLLKRVKERVCHRFLGGGSKLETARANRGAAVWLAYRPHGRRACSLRRRCTTYLVIVSEALVDEVDHVLRDEVLVLLRLEVHPLPLLRPHLRQQLCAAMPNRQA